MCTLSRFNYMQISYVIVYTHFVNISMLLLDRCFIVFELCMCLLLSPMSFTVQE